VSVFDGDKTLGLMVSQSEVFQPLKNITGKSWKLIPSQYQWDIAGEKGTFQI
jgi:hypothetical protein